MAPSAQVALAFSLLCGGATARTTWAELQARPDYSFDDFAEEFGKTYHSEEESKHRRQVFEDNLNWIRTHNVEGRGYTVGLNKFADWTPDEFRKWVRKGSAGARAAPRRTAAWSSAASPRATEDKLDWREKGVVSQVKDQGLCGSCWAFSAAATLESRAAIATGSLVELSEQELVSCSTNPQHCGGKGGCDGSTQALAFEYSKGQCLSSEADYRYLSGDGYTLPCLQKARKPAVCHDGYVELPVNNYTALFDAIQDGPVAISLAAGERPFMLYESGVLDSKTCGYTEDHAVTLVGYGSIHVTLGKNVDYWIVRNSWGDSWGEAGFIRIRRYGEGNEPCGEDDAPHDGSACDGDDAPRTYCGICGILSSSSYPTGVRSASADTVIV